MARGMIFVGDDGEYVAAQHAVAVVGDTVIITLKAEIESVDDEGSVNLVTNAGRYTIWLEDISLVEKTDEDDDR